MDLDLLKNAKEKSEKLDIEGFMNDLKEFLKKTEVEDGIYQVVDFSKDGVFLQNKENNKVFEYKDLPKELKDKISNDYILRCENGVFKFDKELTDKFFEGMVDIKEFIKNKDIE